MPLTRELITAFMNQDLGIDTSGFDGDTLLFSEGIIDSFALVSLVIFVEETFEFRVGPLDVNLANFDSLSRMERYIEKSVGK